MKTTLLKDTFWPSIRRDLGVKYILLKGYSEYPEKITFMFSIFSAN